MTATVFGTSVVILGPESLLAERATRTRINAARHADHGVEVATVDAATLDGGRFAELTGGSLFASSICLIVQDISGLPQELFDLVVATAIDPPDNLVLVLTHPGGVKGKGLLDRLKKGKVEIIDASAVKAWEVPSFVANEARRMKLHMEDGAAQALVDAVGTDLRSLVSALSQLAHDADDEPISRSLVSRYFSGRAEVTSFAVADDIVRGRPGPALEKLRWALSTGVPPVLVTSAIANSLRALGKYFDARSARLPDSELARDIGVPPWKVKEVAQTSRGWTPAGVSIALRAVAKADANVKGAATNADFALEQLLLAVARARGDHGR
ncbi:MAG TPA: DNA polymerase III subunit delta [Propionibacteriaceae bacterium]|nr:DNA polymerase III subunit delta [Propionibacteriaceae bacterium]